ncbi:class IIb bacteriocin, lactobin A/cerein 7B family [Neisseria canis]|uniref:class IIb bacteriocin, lactobin A/cerein 7B family n=1 Tax=Neisseria canis TaxID=493 RepID=UPI000A195652|nr:class IIb bacteriocin, lactobin A/cerein 7B family [Neisseria canis]OSI10335.1 hypothetical protein BWD07_10645 [Neisseria canis]
MKTLTIQELQYVNGAFGPIGAAIGGIGGAAGYLLNQQLSGSKFSPTSLAWATGAGATAGATTGPVGVVWGFNGALAGGMVTGVASRYGK